MSSQRSDSEQPTNQPNEPADNRRRQPTPWWRPLNLIASHAIASYVAIVGLYFANRIMRGGGTADDICFLASAPLMYPFALWFAFHPFLDRPDLQSACLLVVLYAASFTLRSIRTERRYRLQSRHHAGQCLKCGYDLRATPNRCPECGYAPHATPEVDGSDSGPL